MIQCKNAENRVYPRHCRVTSLIRLEVVHVVVLELPALGADETRLVERLARASSQWQRACNVKRNQTFVLGGVAAMTPQEPRNLSVLIVMADGRRVGVLGCACLVLPGRGEGFLVGHDGFVCVVAECTSAQVRRPVIVQQFGGRVFGQWTVCVDAKCHGLQKNMVLHEALWRCCDGIMRCAVVLRRVDRGTFERLSSHDIATSKRAGRIVESFPPADEANAVATSASSAEGNSKASEKLSDG